MNFQERLLRSLVYNTRQMVPSGVHVVEGESYGVRQVDPTAKVPSVTVTVKDFSSLDYELGSYSSKVAVVYTIAAKSRQQRDALKDIVYSGVQHTQHKLYDGFNGFVPTNPTVTAGAAQLGDYVNITDIPMFETDRERLFWTSVMFVEYILI